jgi:hydroxyethylthiazole kinase-like sugar kinase family protein
VAVTGEVDLVVASAGGESLFVGLSANSDVILTKVTAAGCALSALCGAALAAVRNPAIRLEALHAGKAALDAVTLYGVAAERALAAGAVGPGSARVGLLDQLHCITNEQLQAGARASSTVLTVSKA